MKVSDNGTDCGSAVSESVTTGTIQFGPLNKIVGAVRGKIEIDGTPEQVKILLKTIDNCFTAQEQKALVDRGPLAIRVEELRASCAAVYMGRKDGVTYRIKVNPRQISENNEFFLHELIHHSRMVDGDRESILLRTRSEDTDILLILPEDRSLEEAATMLETLARMTPYSEPLNSSYYFFVARKKGRMVYDLIREDRELIAGSADEGSEGLKGKDARDAVEKNFEKSNISDLLLPPENSKPAKERLDELKKEQG